MKRLLIILLSAVSSAFALEPNEILVIANSNCADSVDIANYYCLKRNVPKENIFTLPLAWPADDTIGRADYVKKIAEPVRNQLDSKRFKGRIKCLLTTYGMPVKIAARPMEPGKENDLSQLKSLEKEKAQQLAGIIAQLKLLGIDNIAAAVPDNKDRTSQQLLNEVDAVCKTAIDRIKSVSTSTRQKALYMRWLGYYELIYGKTEALKMANIDRQIVEPPPTQEHDRQLAMAQGHIVLLNNAESEHWPTSKRITKGYYGSLEQVVGLKGTLRHLQTETGRLSGKETNAAVDSELSMVLFDDYELYRWQANELKERLFWVETITMMVSRLDGPGAGIAKGLLDKAMEAEKYGVTGRAYFDLRCEGENNGQYTPGYYDNSLLEAAELVKQKTKWPVLVEKTPKLFDAGQCPRTAVYCGWYSLQKYIPSFTFATGAVGYHIASWEAIHLRDSASSEWCPSLLKNGITATLGAVAEPYLLAFPEPKNFFEELLDGKCLAEAYYRTLPFNSWQIILIGDPLYKLKIK